MSLVVIDSITYIVHCKYIVSVSGKYFVHRRLMEKISYTGNALQRSLFLIRSWADYHLIVASNLRSSGWVSFYTFFFQQLRLRPRSCSYYRPNLQHSSKWQTNNPGKYLACQANERQTYSVSKHNMLNSI